MDEILCPYCGEPGEVDFDPGDSEPGDHRFVQDCAVCCRPWTVVVHRDRDGALTVDVRQS